MHLTDPGSGAPRARDPWWWLVAAGAGLLALRYLAANFGVFTEGDEITIAAGLAAIQRDMPADLYRYGVQFGYYHLVTLLTAVAGGEVYRIPDFMVALSVLAGVALPLMGVLAFQDALSRGERWLLGALLVANPVIWQSSQYGNTAMPSVALTAAAACLLSNRPGRAGTVLALVLFAAAILVRADAVLVSAGLFALLWRQHRNVWRAGLPLVATGMVVGLVVLLALRFDPRMGDLVGQVTSHANDEYLTRFVEFLVFGMSPIPLLMAVAGARDLQRTQPLLLAVLAAWVLPLVVFYFPGTTSPRYLLQLMLPLSVAAAVGVWGSLPAVGRWRRVGGVAILGATFVHLFVGLSAFSPSRSRSWLTEATLPSHDGPVYTGALLYKTFRMRDPRPGRVGEVFRFAPSAEIEKSLAQMFDTLRAGGRQGERVTLLVENGYAEVSQFMAQAGGVRVVGFEPGLPFNRVTRMELGGADFVLVGMGHLKATEERLPVQPGDELWTLFRTRPDAERALAAERPPGVDLVALEPWPGATRLWRYRVAAAP